MQSLPRKQPRRGMEAFASRDFRRFQLARVVAVLGYAAQSVAVAWQVYSITHRAIDLGYTGLVQFIPGLLFLLPAGHAVGAVAMSLLMGVFPSAVTLECASSLV